MMHGWFLSRCNRDGFHRTSGGGRSAHAESRVPWVVEVQRTAENRCPLTATIRDTREMYADRQSGSVGSRLDGTAGSANGQKQSPSIAATTVNWLASAPLSD